MHQYRQPASVAAFVLILLISLIGLYRANYVFCRDNPGGVDFLPRWMGARFWLIEGVSPYDDKVSLATQIASFGEPAEQAGRGEKGYFLYPLPVMILIAPFGFFDYVHARALWMTFSEIALLGIVFLGYKIARRQDTHTGMVLISSLFILLIYPSAKAILNGHIVVFDLFFIVLGVYLLMRAHDLPAGLVFSLVVIKADFALLVILFLLIWTIRQRRYEFFYGILGGGGLLFAISLLFIPDWPLQHLRQIWGVIAQGQSLVNIISQQAPGIQKQLFWILLLSFIAYLLFEWFQSFSGDEYYLVWCSCVTLTITCFIRPFANVANYVLLIPALILIFRVILERWRTLGGIFIGLSMIGLGAGMWWIVFRGNTALSEPFSIYITLPLYTLLGLWWVRWWALRPPRVYLDEITRKVE